MRTCPFLLLSICAAAVAADMTNESLPKAGAFSLNVPQPETRQPTTSQPAASPLTLDRVLRSVKANFPPLLATLQEREIADADVLGSTGRFDRVVRARGDMNRFGYYTNERVDVSFEQPLQWQGLSLYSGYRFGDGNYPVYDSYYQTRSAGEWRAGAKLPLLRGRETDARRTDLAKTRIGQRLADLSIDGQKIAVIQAGSRRYWDWVAAGRRYQVAQRLLKIARTREEFLEESVHQGQLPAIEVTDNKRVIAQREAQLAEGERFLQQAAIELSLYLRDGFGAPILPPPAELPANLPAPTLYPSDRLAADLALAIKQRPEATRLTAQQEQLNLDLRLAQNDALPQFDLLAGATTEHGSGPVLRGPQDLKAGLVFELPVQRRVAKGRQQAVKARQQQVALRLGYAQDQIRAEVRDAVSALTQAYGRSTASEAEVSATRQVEDAERTRYDLGEGTLFTLNIRELQTAEAEFRYIAALADYQRAQAQYEYALANALQSW